MEPPSQTWGANGAEATPNHGRQIQYAPSPGYYRTQHPAHPNPNHPNYEREGARDYPNMPASHAAPPHQNYPHGYHDAVAPTPNYSNHAPAAHYERGGGYMGAEPSPAPNYSHGVGFQPVGTIAPNYDLRAAAPSHSRDDRVFQPVGQTPTPNYNRGFQAAAPSPNRNRVLSLTAPTPNYNRGSFQVTDSAPTPNYNRGFQASAPSPNREYNRANYRGGQNHQTQSEVKENSSLKANHRQFSSTTALEDAKTRIENARMQLHGAGAGAGSTKPSMATPLQSRTGPAHFKF